jgi:hypothetical protein
LLLELVISVTASKAKIELQPVRLLIVVHDGRG